MSKRGSIELILFVAVAVVAFGGIFFFLRNSNAGMMSVIYAEAPDNYDVLTCQTRCSRIAGGPVLQRCLADCRASIEYPSVPLPTGQFYVPAVAELESGNEITGHFVLPGAKAYGGEIRGVSAPGTRAFPAGRAYELPEQSCFTCDCLDQGITAVDRAAAEQVCMNNCGGQVTDVVVGICQ